MTIDYSKLLAAVSRLPYPSVHPAQYHTFVNSGSTQSVLEWSPSSTPSGSRRESRATADDIGLNKSMLLMPETTCVSEDRLSDFSALTALLQECNVPIVPLASTDRPPTMPYVGREPIIAEFFRKASMSVHHVVNCSGESRTDLTCMDLTGPAGSGKSRTLAELPQLLLNISSDSSIMQLPGARLLQQMMKQELFYHLAVDFQKGKAAIDELVEDKLDPNCCMGIVLVAAHLKIRVKWLLEKIRGKDLNIFQLSTVLGWVVHQYRANLADAKQQRAPVLLLITTDNSQFMPSSQHPPYAIQGGEYAQYMFLDLAAYASDYGVTEDGAAVALMAAGTFIPALAKMLPTEMVPVRKALSPLTVSQATAAVAGALAKNKAWCQWAHDHVEATAVVEANRDTSAQAEADGDVEAEVVRDILEFQLRSTLALDYIAECGGRARYLSVLVDYLLASAEVLHPYTPGALVAAVHHAFTSLHTEVKTWPTWTIKPAAEGKHELSAEVVTNIFYLAYSGIPVSLKQDMGSSYTLQDVAQAGVISLEPVLECQDDMLFVVSLPRMILRSTAPRGFPTHSVTTWAVGEEKGLDWEKVVSGQLMLQCLALKRLSMSQVPLRSVFAGAFGGPSVLDIEVIIQDKYIETRLAESQHLFSRDVRKPGFGTTIQVQSPTSQKQLILLVASYAEKVTTQHSKRSKPWSDLTDSIISVDRYEGDSHPIVDLVVPFQTACNSSSGSISSSGSGSTSSSGTNSNNSGGSGNGSLLVWVQVKKIGPTELPVEQLQVWHQRVKAVTSEYNKHHRQVYAYVTTQKMMPQVLQLLEQPEYADLLVVPRQTYEVFSPALRGRMAVEKVQASDMKLGKDGRRTSGNK